MNKHTAPFRPRLSLKFFAALLLALAVAFTVYLLIYEGGMPWLLYGKRFFPMWEGKMQAAVADFQRYVDQNALSRRDSDQIQAWQKGHPEAYLFLDDLDSVYEDTDYGCIVQFSDGAQFATAYVSDTYYSAIGRVVALGLAALCFLLVMFPFIYRLLWRFTRLSREMEIVTAGDLEHKIVVQGRDELSALGENIERLRRSVLERIQREQAAIQANRELVTALSHDLRTPLTKQIGYLEILQRHMYHDEEELREYQEQVWRKALQMKELSDHIFQSFQVGGEDPAQPPEVVAGNELLGQILEEQAYDLKCQGFTVELPSFTAEFLLEVSPADILRVFDNLFSNLKKYADPVKSIPVTYHEMADEVCVSIENRIKTPAPAVESSQIGLNTVRVLLEHNHGRIKVRRDAENYYTELYFLKYKTPLA